VLAVAGHGKAQFALQTQYLLNQLDDKEGVICVGGAGGLDPRLGVGDIVVGTDTVEHDYRIRFVLALPPVYPADKALLAGLQSVPQSAQIEGAVWFDRIASGDEDIVERTRAKELREQTRAVCVAWEGSGASRAAAFNDIPFVEIRGITDAANDTAHGDYHQNLQIVMPRIAKLLAEWRLQRCPVA
jgi:adenosylhomocysteine nucleosidase